MSELAQKQRVLRALGLCRAAGRLVMGTDLVCRAMQGGNKEQLLCVLMAGDASANTEKKLTDKCAFYGVKLVRVDIPMAELATAIGKRGGQTAAVATADENFATLLFKALGIDEQNLTK